MHDLDYNEQIQHRTGDYPLAFYRVDVHHERYHMPMHWHRETEIIRIRKGLLNLYIDDREVCARAGDLMLIAEGAVHGGSPEDCEYDCVVFDAALLLGTDACARQLKDVINHCIFLQREVIEDDPLFSAALGQLFALCAAGVEDNVLGITGALFASFGRLVKKRPDARLDAPSSRFGQKAEQLKPALEYIETHYGQPISLETLARLTGMSPKYFCRFFRTVVHRSPIDYVNYYRIECASHFLSSGDMTVAEIAQHCGYNDSSFFIKQFRKYKGTTPKQYRRLS